ncbi:MptD family putative ECF transporter S component [Streptococcus sp. DD12]|uniref:MptD family putative ECF transporter S component n=1 Tax=Streptococcus sp. DD12 TaxID=1777880 RepID=UPI00079618AC|nr:MptD family putative ECF transporter S component [Streptococcus sp. DD12]KXT76655.1 Substrate-specific component of putative ECF transporter [Streptococcus sp. DD12]
MKKLGMTMLFAVVYFCCVGLGVLLANVIDHTGNMFYAPACSAFVGGLAYWYFVERIRTFGAITFVGLVLAGFFLLTRHGAGAFLPAIICGLLADVISRMGRYKNSPEQAISFFVFAFGTTGPILMMWFARADYIASLLARGKSQAYIDRVMVAPDIRNILLFVVATLIGAVVGSIIGHLWTSYRRTATKIEILDTEE